MNFLCVPVEDNPVKVWGIHICECYFAGFYFMNFSTQLIDTNQHIVSDRHPNEVSKSLEMKEKEI